MNGVVLYKSNSSKVDAIRGICSDGSWSLFSRFRLEYLESEGVFPEVIHCPQAKVVTGLLFKFNQALKALKDVNITCGPRNTPYEVQDDGSIALSVLDNSGQKQSVRCPSGSLVTGIIARSTFYSIQGLGLKCASVSKGTLSTINVAGNLLGDVAEKDCTPGYFLEGVEGSTETTLNGIKATCFDGIHTSIVGESKGLAFRVTCPAGHGVIGFMFSVDTSVGVNGLETLCKPTSSLSYVATTSKILRSQSSSVATPSPSPKSQVSSQMTKKLTKATKTVGKEGYVGVIRFDEPSTDEICHLEPAVSLTFDDFDMEQDLFGPSSTIRPPATAAPYTKAEAHILCGENISPTSDGCMWNATDFLGLLYEQGVFLLRSGASQRTAFAMYVHGIKLAWNRIRCSPGSTKKTFSVPPNYESLYGVVSARIVSAIKESGAGLPELQNVKPERFLELHRMKTRAIKWDVGEEISTELFPTKDFLLPPRNTDVSGIAITISDSDLTSEDESVRFLREGMDEQWNPMHRIDHIGEYNEDEKRRLKDHNENLPSLYRATTAFIPYLCGPMNKYFPLQFVGTRGRPLVHYYQHCCSRACEAYAKLSRIPNIGSGLYQCCRICNKYDCGMRNRHKRTLFITAKASVVQTPAKKQSGSQGPSVYFFAI